MVGDAGLDRPSRRSSTGCATTGINPTKASGRRAAGASRSCTGGSCAGSRSIAPSASPSTARTRHRSNGGPTERDRIYRAIHDKGWNDELQAFVQYEGSDVLDASLLLMPLMGFISPMDPKWISTLEAMDRTLVSDSLVYRYDPKASPDGLQGSEGTFSICTFWYVSALARTGRIADARLTFEKMLTYANHLGLFSEEIGATGEQLGNFPQAFTHLSLVLAAIDLDHVLDP